MINKDLKELIEDIKKSEQYKSLSDEEKKKMLDRCTRSSAIGKRFLTILADEKIDLNSAMTIGATVMLSVFMSARLSFADFKEIMQKITDAYKNQMKRELEDE